jgi:hypothetical protein
MIITISSMADQNQEWPSPPEQQMATEKAQEGSQELSWQDASMQAREEEIQSIICLRCALGTSWTHGHDHECPKFLKKNKKTTTKKTGASMQARREEAIQSIFCLGCALGSIWRDGHDHECPKFKKKKTKTKKTGACRKKTERKSRENKKRQEKNGSEAKSSMSANGEQKYSHATTTPSVVSTMTTVETMSPIGAVTTTSTGVYHPSPSSPKAVEQFPRALPLFFPSPMFMMPIGRYPIFYQHSPLLAPSLTGPVFHPRLPRPLPFLAQCIPLIVRPPVGIARKRRKPQVEYRRCCEKYCKYHVVDKPAGKKGAPPHCLDCPVRKQFRQPNNGPKGPYFK